MKREETIDYNIKAAWHGIYRIYNQIAIQHDITTSIGFVLLNISSKGTQATKIAPLMGMEARSLTRMLKTMEEKKLISKKKDKKDGRSVLIFLTKKGREKKEIARKTVKKFNQEIKNKIPKKKMDTFFEVIREINLLIDKNEILKTIS